MLDHSIPDSFPSCEFPRVSRWRGWCAAWFGLVLLVHAGGADAQDRAAEETSGLIVQAERLSRQAEAPFVVLGREVDHFHPLWERYQPALAAFPSTEDCLSPQARTPAGWDLSALAWTRLSDHRDIEVCLFRISATLGSVEGMKAWLRDQGYQVHGPQPVARPNEGMSINLAAFLPGSEFDSRIGFPPPGWGAGVLEWLMPTPPIAIMR